MFEGSAYCPQCGARRSRTAGGPRTARCPACAGTVREIEIGDTILMECDRCRGMWIDASTFEHICADRQTQTAVLHQWSTPPAARGATEIHYRKCVACGKMMNRVNFGKVSGTVVDVCKGHGTFLDAGELHLIVSFIQHGGLERARQRQIEELKEQEEHLRTMQQIQSRLPAEIHIERGTQTWTGADLLALLEHLKRR
jgi:Zn-finger nucleic acid-binding protein